MKYTQLNRESPRISPFPPKSTGQLWCPAASWGQLPEATWVQIPSFHLDLSDLPTYSLATCNPSFTRMDKEPVIFLKCKSNHVTPGDKKHLIASPCHWTDVQIPFPGWPNPKRPLPSLPLQPHFLHIASPPLCSSHASCLPVPQI